MENMDEVGGPKFHADFLPEMQKMSNWQAT
jgi:hypothetical protein